MTNSGSWASSRSEMYFFTNRIISFSEALAVDEPELIARCKAAGTSSGASKSIQGKFVEDYWIGKVQQACSQDLCGNYII